MIAREETLDNNMLIVFIYHLMCSALNATEHYLHGKKGGGKNKQGKNIAPNLVEKVKEIVYIILWM